MKSSWLFLLGQNGITLCHLTAHILMLQLSCTPQNRLNFLKFTPCIELGGQKQKHLQSLGCCFCGRCLRGTWTGSSSGAADCVEFFVLLARGRLERSEQWGLCCCHRAQGRGGGGYPFLFIHFQILGMTSCYLLPVVLYVQGTRRSQFLLANEGGGTRCAQTREAIGCFCEL